MRIWNITIRNVKIQATVYDRREDSWYNENPEALCEMIATGNVPIIVHIEDEDSGLVRFNGWLVGFDAMRAASGDSFETMIMEIAKAIIEKALGGDDFEDGGEEEYDGGEEEGRGA